MYEKTHSKAIQERVVEDYISESLRNFYFFWKPEGIPFDFRFPLMVSNPCPNTPQTDEMERNAFGSICLM